MTPINFRKPLIICFLALLSWGCQPASETSTPPQTVNEDQLELSGEKLFAENCASCHNGSVQKAPHKDMLNLMPPDYTLKAMTAGIMQSQSAHLTRDEKKRVAEYLGMQSLSAKPFKLPAKCTGNALIFDQNEPPKWLGWGGDLGNSRLHDADITSINSKSIPNLKLKWAVEMPGATRARSQPMLAGGSLFIGGADGTFMALDAKTGCLRWIFQARAEVRHAAFIEPWEGSAAKAPRLYFGDLLGHVYAVNAKTGTLIWTHRADPHPNATITAAPVLHDGRVFFAVSALEVTSAADAKYECCTFRGSMVAYDAASGDKLWQTYTIDNPATKQGQNDLGTKLYGPSGAPLWASVAIDQKRNQIYAGSGENYSSPGSDRSDAVIAFDMNTGKINWTMQALADDVWNMACMSEYPIIRQACPKENGPDYDFGAGIIYAENSNFGDRVIAGQKSGDLFFIDPDNGEIIKKTKIGRGGIQAGIHFGMALDGDTLYVPISDFPDGREPVELAKPGMFAVSTKDAEVNWFTRDPDDVCVDRDFCTPGISAAPTAFEGAVIAGSMDGNLRAYDKETGDVIWSFDTTKPVKTLTGTMANGGSMGGSAGPIAKDNMLYVVSGYGIYYHMPGAVLLAFEVASN